MKTRAIAVMDDTQVKPGAYELIEVELEDPRQNEILVRMVAAGLCHSDDHIATGDLAVTTYPFVLGHEGAGVVEKVGPNTPGFEVGDHVVFQFIPGCGRCRWCAQGMQNLCDTGALAMHGSRFDDDKSFRVHMDDGRDVGQLCGIGTFADYTTVDVTSAVKVDKDLPLASICLLSCGVGTGFGSAVNGAEVQPMDAVIIMGIGGIGINAVQGARHAGAAYVIAVDPVAFKRQKALELGATHAFASIDEAHEFVKTVTNGQGADKVIVTIGITTGEHVAQAVAAVRKAGTVMVTGIGDGGELGIPISPTEFTLMQKRIQGGVFGLSRPSWDIKAQIQMYREGSLKLDELITNTYKLEDIKQGFADLHAGKNIRGVVLFD